MFHVLTTCLLQEGEKKANYWGSLCMASTVRLGNDAQGNAVHVPLRNLLPTVHPNDLVLGGWDICSDNLADAMVKASVLVCVVVVLKRGGRHEKEKKKTKKKTKKKYHI